MKPILADNRGLRESLSLSRQVLAQLEHRPLGQWPEHVRSHLFGRLFSLHELLEEGRRQAMRRYAAGETADPQAAIRHAFSVAADALRSLMEAMFALPGSSHEVATDHMLLAVVQQAVMQLDANWPGADAPP